MQYDSVDQEIDLTGIGTGVIRPSIAIKATSDAAVFAGFSTVHPVVEYD